MHIVTIEYVNDKTKKKETVSQVEIISGTAGKSAVENLAQGVCMMGNHSVKATTPWKADKRIYPKSPTFRFFRERSKIFMFIARAFQELSGTVPDYIEEDSDAGDFTEVG